MKNQSNFGAVPEHFFLLQFKASKSKGIKRHSFNSNVMRMSQLKTTRCTIIIVDQQGSLVLLFRQRSCFSLFFFFLLDCFVFPFSYFGRLKRSDAEWSCGNGWLPIHPELEIGGCDSDFFFFSSFVVRRRPSPPIHRPNRATVCGRLVPEHRPYRYVNTLRTVRR